MSIKWALIFLALFIVVSIGAGFIKGAIQQRKFNKEAAKNAPPKEKSSGKDSAEKSADKKSREKPKKKKETKKPKRLVDRSAEQPEDRTGPKL